MPERDGAIRMKESSYVIDRRTSTFLGLLFWVSIVKFELV